MRVVAPASCFERERFDRGLEVWKKLGFRVSWREDLFARDRYLAGSDERRAAELAEAFAMPDVKGVVCMRGGYGTPRILERLDFGALVKSPKVFLGFSDITALHFGFRTAGLGTFHGPNFGGLDGASPAEVDSLLRTVGDPKPAGLFAEGRTVTKGTAEGPLLGGTLSMIGAVLGSRFVPSFEGAILFLEDTGEKAFRLDRVLTQLGLAGILGAAAGIAIGRFSKGEAPPLDPEATVEAIVKATGKPAIAGLPFGHEGENRTLPIGVRARIEDGRLTILEGAVT